MRAGDVAEGYVVTGGSVPTERSGKAKEGVGKAESAWWRSGVVKLRLTRKTIKFVEKAWKFDRAEAGTKQGGHRRAVWVGKNRGKNDPKVSGGR